MGKSWQDDRQRANSLLALLYEGLANLQAAEREKERERGCERRRKQKHIVGEEKSGWVEDVTE